MDDLSSDYKLLTAVKEMSEQLAMVALYRVVELNMKNVLIWRYKPEEVEKLDIKEIGKLLAKDGIQLQNIANFDAADESRRINNAIKHKNKVTKDLTKYPGWTEGDELRNLEPAYNRLSPKIPKFIEDFAEKVIPPHI